MIKMMKKITKEAARYVDRAKYKHCRDCSMYVDHGLHGCTLVMGWIEAKGNCKHWEAKNKLPVKNKTA